MGFPLATAPPTTTALLGFPGSPCHLQLPLPTPGQDSVAYRGPRNLWLMWEDYTVCTTHMVGRGDCKKLQLLRTQKLNSHLPS